MNLSELRPGDRVEYWYTTFEDGRTVHRGTVIVVYEGVVGVREDGRDDFDLVPLLEVIRTI